MSRRAAPKAHSPEARSAEGSSAPVRSLADLHGVKSAISARQQLEAERAASRERERQRVEQENNLFQRAAGKVQPMPAHARAPSTQVRPTPEPRQFQRDEAAALAETLSDEFDVSTLLDIDDQMSFRQSGIGSDVTRKLRRGHWSIQRVLDLHGLRSDGARSALAAFIREATQHGIRCVRVVHGKGLGSPGKAPVLKNKVHAWLVQKKEVLAFVQARPADGGAGAVVVLLASAPAA